MFRHSRRPGQRPTLVAHLRAADPGAVPWRDEWFFTGRCALLERIVAWIQAAAPGSFVITGPAGSGKSAVLDRIVALSDPAERAALLEHAPLDPADPDPGVGVVHAAVPLRGQDALGIAIALAADLGLPTPQNCWQLIAAVAGLPSPPLLVLDGLDEAMPEQVTEIVTDLLVPLGVVTRLLFTTRNQEFGRRRPGTGEPGGVPLAELFGRTMSIADLEADTDTTDDVEQYLMRRLRDTVQAELVPRVAAALARAAVERGGFLYARILADQIVGRVVDVSGADWEQHLPATAVEAFERQLSGGAAQPRDGAPGPATAREPGPATAREPGPDTAREPGPDTAREVLRALAWGLGAGLPDHGVWEAVATALSPSGVRYRTADLDRVLERYGCYVVEDAAAGEAVYRLCHRQLIDHLVESSPPIADRPAGQVLADALVALAEEQSALTGEPDQCSPYLQRHLARHALMAGPSGVLALHRLAGGNPEGFLPELAISLNQLAAHMGTIGRRQGALVAIQQAVDTYRLLADVNPDDYLPGLAASEYNLAAQLAELGRHEAALLPAQQAVDTYRELADDYPETYLPNLAMALNNLAVYFSELGHRQAALAPGAEAVDTYRLLSEVDAKVYFTNLVTALKNFAAHLAALDRISDGVDIYTTCVTAFADSPAARDAMIIERAGFHILHGDPPTGLRELATLLCTADENETPDPIVLAARNAMRGYSVRNAATVERAWRTVSGTEPPNWLSLTPEQIAVVVEWLMVPNWAESKSFFTAHSDELLAYPALVALDELELLVASRTELHRELIDMVQEDGLDEAYRPLLLRDLVTDWISAKNWQDSRSFAEAHATDLLTGEAEVALFGLGQPTATVVHLALLRLARREGIGAAYAFVTDRQLAAKRMRQALLEVEPDFIAELAALEGQVFGEQFTAAAHLAVAASLMGEMVTDSAKLEELAEQADPAGRRRVAAEIAELLDRVPNQAELRSVLPEVLLRPAQETSSTRSGDASGLPDAE